VTRRFGDVAGPVLRDVRRAVGWHRRLVVALLVAATTAATVSALAPPPPQTAPVLAAARDLAAGAPITSGDLRVVRLPPAAVPTGVLREPAAAVGRRPVGPVRAGEPLTDARLLGPSLVAGYATAAGADVVGAPVRIADPGAAALLRAGDRVDVLAATTESGPGQQATIVAADVPVVAVPPASAGGLDEGGLVVLATTTRTAAVLARAAVTSRLSVTVRGTPVP
jgi:Flp pilus assembly protein CpaB